MLTQYCPQKKEEKIIPFADHNSIWGLGIWRLDWCSFRVCEEGFRIVCANTKSSFINVLIICLRFTLRYVTNASIGERLHGSNVNDRWHYALIYFYQAFCFKDSLKNNCKCSRKNSSANATAKQMLIVFFRCMFCDTNFWYWLFQF